MKIKQCSLSFCVLRDKIERLKDLMIAAVRSAKASGALDDVFRQKDER